MRELVASPWWRTAAPQQRAEQVVARMLWGSGEWWLFGAWGRWYRCGLDGVWHPCPPPTDPGERRVAQPAPRGAGSPPVPPQLFPTGPDLTAGRVASLGFLGAPPETAVVARIQQALTTAWAVNPAQFAQQDPMFQPGTPSTVAAAWSSLLWCAGAPVVLTENPLIESFVPFLTTPAERLHWMMPPDFGTLAGYYINRLQAGDGAGAAHIARVMYEVAVGLQADARFRPGADALAAVTAASLRLVHQDMATARYGPAAMLQEWRRRCPAEFAMPMVRDAAPGEYLRLALYDLQQAVAGLTGSRAPVPTGGRPHDDVRRAAVALLAADLQAAPNALPALHRWLDPDSARTLHAVLTDPANPLRALWPREGRLPEALRSTDAEALSWLLATTYTIGLTWCRLAQVPPPATGFAVPQAVAAELTSPALHSPPSTDELSAWDIIKAARAHLAAERQAAEKSAEEAADRPVAPSPAEPPPPSPPSASPPSASSSAGGAESAAPEPPPAAGLSGSSPDGSGERRAAASVPPPPPVPPAPPTAPVWPSADPGAEPGAGPAGVLGDAQEGAVATQLDPGAFATQVDPEEGRDPLPPPPVPVSEPPPPVPPAPSLEAGPQIAEAYGIRFLCGADDIERVVTEVRRRGKWARRLRGQEVSTASMPALLLIGAPSSGQRRLARMVARALAEVGVCSGEVHGVHADEVRGRGPAGLRGVLDEHAGHALLLDGLDALVLDDPQGRAYAERLYEARLEGVSDTTLLATCAPARVAELSAASPELMADLRAVRLPDMNEPRVRAGLLALLAEERRVRLGPDAWEVVHRDLGLLRGRGRLTGARLVEAYLDRAVTRRLGRADATQAIDEVDALTLTASDLEGLAAELSG
ncbi:UNVERIFIED_ORG: hypothetical protein CLV66_11548 [Actinomadura viridilutea]